MWQNVNFSIIAGAAAKLSWKSTDVFFLPTVREMWHVVTTQKKNNNKYLNMSKNLSGFLSGHKMNKIWGSNITWWLYNLVTL